MAFFRPGKDNKPQQGTADTSDRTEMLGNFSDSPADSGAGGASSDVTKNLGSFDGDTMLPSEKESNPFNPGIMEDMDEAVDDEPMAEEGKTQVVGGFGVASPEAAAIDDGSVGEEAGHPKGPVTGWLVVIHGPEKGESFALRHGPQIISRGDEADVVLKDGAVSRSKQATVHYDPNMGEFSLYRGQATPNMYTSRGGKMSSLHVGMNHILELGDEIVFGDNLSTRLRFVPLCGNGFSWRDLE